jgi:TonB family protein
MTPSGSLPGVASPGIGSPRAASPGTRGGAPGSSGLDAAAVANSRTRYLRSLTARIRQHRQYPYLARRQGLEGTVCVRISLGARGQLVALRVTCGGENVSLVEAAMTAVTDAAPFEPLPPDLGTSLAVEVPIVFRLEEG